MVLYWSPEMIQLQRRDRRVVAGDRRHRIDARGLEGGDRAAAGAVVGRDDAEDLGAEALDLAARPLLGLGRRPVRGVVLGQRLVAAAARPSCTPSLIRPAAASVGEPLICSTPPLSLATPCGFEVLDQASAIALPIALLSKDT